MAGRTMSIALSMTVMMALASLAGALAGSTADQPSVGEVREFGLSRDAPSFGIGSKWTPSMVDRSEAALNEMYPGFDAYPSHAKEALMKAPDPNIADMLTKLDMTDVKQLFNDLESKSKPNRLTGTQRYKDAADWIKGVVNTRAPNLEVTYQEWSTYRNIVISLKGDGTDTTWYELGGHLDSVSAGPGMDDDGSGSLGSAFIALAMAQYKFKSNLRFLLFDAEESGLVGSNHYVQSILSSCPPTTCLKYYINMDMMAYDPNNGKKFGSNTGKTYLQDLHSQVITDYTIDIGINRGGAQGCNTDHCYYQRNGYDEVSDDEAVFSRCYHAACDLVAEFNWETMLNTFKTVAGVLATSAGMLGKGNQTGATRIDVTPKNPTITTIGQQQFTGKGFDAAGQPATLPGAIAWTASAGTINPAGLYTPAGAGSFTVTATSGTLTDTTNVTVTQGGVVSIKVAPNAGTIREHETQTFTAEGCTAVPVCTPTTVDQWAQTGGGVKASIDTAGVFTPDGAATYKVTATKGALVGTANLTVEALVLTSLTLKTSGADCTSPAANKVDCRVTSTGIQFVLTGVDSAGATINFDPIKDGHWFDGQWIYDTACPTGSGFPVVRADMVVVPSKVAVCKYTGHGFNKDSNTLEVNFVPGPMTTMKLTPEATQSVPGKGTVQFAVEAKDAKGNDIVTLAPTRLTNVWTVNPSTIATVDSSGLLTGVKMGAGEVKVEVTDSMDQVKKSDTTSVTVTSDGTPPVAPTVVSNVPADGTKQVALDSKIVVTFDLAMDKAATQAAISASPTITGTFSWSTDSKTVTWTPASALTVDKTYVITVSKAAKSSQAAVMVSAHTFSFGTGSAGGGGGGGGGGGAGGIFGMGAMMDLVIPLIIILVIVAVVAMMLMGRKKKSSASQQQGYWQQGQQGQPDQQQWQQPPQGGPPGGWG